MDYLCPYEQVQCLSVSCLATHHNTTIYTYYNISIFCTKKNLIFKNLLFLTRKRKPKTYFFLNVRFPSASALKRINCFSDRRAKTLTLDLEWNIRRQEKFWIGPKKKRVKVTGEMSGWCSKTKDLRGVDENAAVWVYRYRCYCGNTMYR